MSSGEASGDHYTAALARTLRAAGYEDEIWGMGGVESRHAGIKIEWDGERLQLLGFTEVLSAIPSIFALRREMVQRILDRQPEAVVVVDSPDYHMRLIAKLRGKGYRGKVFYIFFPVAWPGRNGRTHCLCGPVDQGHSLPSIAPARVTAAVRPSKPESTRDNCGLSSSRDWVPGSLSAMKAR